MSRRAGSPESLADISPADQSRGGRLVRRRDLERASHPQIDARPPHRAARFGGTDDAEPRRPHSALSRGRRAWSRIAGIFGRRLLRRTAGFGGTSALVVVSLRPELRRFDDLHEKDSATKIEGVFGYREAAHDCILYPAPVTEHRVQRSLLCSESSTTSCSGLPTSTPR